MAEFEDGDFQLWYKLFELVRDHEFCDPRSPSFWNRMLEEDETLSGLRDKYHEFQLLAIWIDMVEPRLEKFVMDPKIRKRFLLPKKASCSEEWNCATEEVEAARKRAREKLAQFRTDQQMELVQTKEFDWPGKDFGFPDEGNQDENEATSLSQPCAVEVSTSRAKATSGINTKSASRITGKLAAELTGVCLFETETGGEPMTFFFFRDGCSMTSVFEKVNDMTEEIEMRGGKVHKWWSDARRGEYTILLTFDDIEWHKACVRESCAGSGRDIFSVKFITESIQLDMVTDLNQHRIRSGYLCNEYDANKIAQRELTWTAIDESIGANGHGPGCRACGTGTLRYEELDLPSEDEDTDAGKLNVSNIDTPVKVVRQAVEKPIGSHEELLNEKEMEIMRTYLPGKSNPVQHNYDVDEWAEESHSRWLKAAEGASSSKKKLKVAGTLGAGPSGADAARSELKSCPKATGKPLYVPLQNEIVSAIVVVRREIGKNPTTKAEWMLVCTEMKKQYDELFMTEVRKHGRAPTIRGGVDPDKKEYNPSYVERVLYRNILPNHKKFKKLTTTSDDKNFLATWYEDVCRKRGEKGSK